MPLCQPTPLGVRTRLLCCAATIAAAMCSAVASGQTWQEATDYAMLKSRVSASLPTGAGGQISLVEFANPDGTPPDAYYIDLASPEFTSGTDPFGAALALTDGSGMAFKGNSGHATNVVGANYFGNSLSMAPGANNVTIYEVNHWLGSILHYNDNSPPVAQSFRVQNHSWIADSLGSTSQDLSTLRRLDYLIETGEMTAAIGANNANPASPPPHPLVFAHSYNAITVGRTDGRHSRGQTSSIYGSGRFKPDIVAPAPSTSTATARVSSAAALLHEAVAGTDAARSETMRALLMAGATKQEFAAFVDPTTATVNPWNRTATRPLDDLFGAGELNIYNSYLIQRGGQHAGSVVMPAASAGTHGWDYQDRKNDSSVGDLFYNFEIPAGSTAQELSIMLAWNAKITDTNGLPGVFTPTESLQNLDLRFYNSTASFLGNLLDESISTIDNVEHIYQTNLGPGQYTLRVSGAANWDYGLAWRMTTAFDHVSADFDEDGVVTGSDFLTWQRNVGTLLGASHSNGDADGDGDVDGLDLVALDMGIVAPASASPGGPAGPNPAGPGGNSVNGGAVPEPATIGSLAAGLLWLAAGRMDRRTRRPRRRR